MPHPNPTRRQFLRTLGAASIAFPYVGCRHVSAPPSGVLRHASFGAAGMAWADIQAICSNPFVKLVAVADVDLNRVKQVKEAFPDVRVYQDWRRLLDKEGRHLDSVNVSTPDHLHAPIALSAMQLGKHCYCQKPLAHNLHETRALTRYAQGRPLVTQMGIQIHSEKVYRQAVALLRSGAIGKVKEVHTWSSKKWGDLGAPPAGISPVPEGFDWDLWLGPGADRPYLGGGYYHPGNWRKRLDFGTGTFGDMGCHIFDPVFEGLALTSPISLRSEGPAPDRWNWSINARIHYVFPGTPYTAEDRLPVTWYDGDQRPPADLLALITPPELSEASSNAPANTDEDPREAARRRALARRIPLDQGSIFVGTKGLLHLPHIGTPRLLPEASFKDHPLPDVPGSHHWSDWAEACVGKAARPLAPFDYSGPLTEAVLLGSVAVRFPQRTLEWNAAELRFTNEAAANAFVRREYRPGWEFAGL